MQHELVGSAEAPVCMQHARLTRVGSAEAIRRAIEQKPLQDTPTRKALTTGWLVGIPPQPLECFISHLAEGRHRSVITAWPDADKAEAVPRPAGSANVCQRSLALPANWPTGDQTSYAISPSHFARPDWPNHVRSSPEVNQQGASEPSSRPLARHSASTSSPLLGAKLVTI
jgi:hypothetical protein